MGTNKLPIIPTYDITLFRLSCESSKRTDWGGTLDAVHNQALREKCLSGYQNAPKNRIRR